MSATSAGTLGKSWTSRVEGPTSDGPAIEGVCREPEHTEAFPQCAALQPAAVVAPFHPYGRSVGASVLAGDFYRGTAYPELYRGNLFFADFVEGFIKRVVFDANGNPASFPVFATGIDGIVDLKQGPDGLLYYVDFVSGQIRRIRFNGPTAAASATPTDGYSPLAVTFSSAGSTAPSGGTLTYLWDFGDGTTSTEANPVHVYTASSVRSFVARLTVSSGGLTSRATLRITVGSRPPEPVILAPAEGSSFQPGDLVSYQGSANDPDDGTLPAERLDVDGPAPPQHPHPHVRRVRRYVGQFPDREPRRRQRSPTSWC